MLNKTFCHFILLIFLISNVSATEHVIRGIGMEWKPLVTFAKPGDKIKFVDMVGHDTVSVEGMIPPNADSWKSKMSEEGFTVTLNKDGLYVYKCSPHVAVGMFGAIIVGEAISTPDNFDQAYSNLSKVRIGKNAVKKVFTKVKRAINLKSSN